MRTLSPEAALHAMELASQPYRPAAIVELKEKIETATARARKQMEERGQVPAAHVERIVAMQRELDGLYLDWAEGKIS